MQIFTIRILIIVHYFSSVFSVKVSPCAQWNQTGTTVAGTGEPGNSSYQLNQPMGIFIRESVNKLYVADTKNNRIQMFTLGQSTIKGITVASTHGEARKIFIDEDNGPTIYVSIFDKHRVEKWTDGALEGVQVGDECYFCTGIAIDKEKNIFMASFNNLVTKWSPQTNSTSIVAGTTNRSAAIDERLLGPSAIYIRKNDNSLYVADTVHNRIQRWPNDAKKGITVAGPLFYSPVNENDLLYGPSSVLLDEDNDLMYIAEGSKQRIQRWFVNASEGETIVGRSGSAEQLQVPVDIAFDNEGNIYVCDMKSHRVQMFALINNRPCSTNSTETILNSLAISSYKNPYHGIIMVIMSLWNVIILK